MKITINEAEEKKEMKEICSLLNRRKCDEDTKEKNDSPIVKCFRVK